MSSQNPVAKLLSPFDGLTTSIKDWLENVAKTSMLDDYAEPAFLGALFFLLFIHFFSFALENNVNLQNWSPALAQSLYEVRIFLQTVVIKNLLFYSAFILGLMVGGSRQSVYTDLMLFGPYVGLIVVIVIINKVTVLVTGHHNPEYNSVYSAADPLLSLTKSKWLYIPVIWIQAVTDIIIQQVAVASMYGYAVGKVVAAIKR